MTTRLTAVSTAFPLALAYLREKPLATLLNIVLLGLGVGTIISLSLTLSQAEKSMDRDATGIDLVIGAKGSPLQIILSTVFHIDIPTGNISVAEAERVTANPAVKQAIPLALGDSFKTFRIVGTSPAYVELYGASLQSGRIWNSPLEAVLGAEVARITGLIPSAAFASAHGLTDGGNHADHPYKVVGVLKSTGSVIDRVILTSVESVWMVHEHTEKPDADQKINTRNNRGHADQENNMAVTAYLVQYATPLAAASFPRMVNANSGLQAASPAMETARLFNLLGFGITALKGFAIIMMVCAALGIFVGLMNALDERRTDLALLRVMGASRATVFLTIVSQGFALGVAGVILGVFIGHAGVEWIGDSLDKTHRIALTGFTVIAEEFWIAAGALGLAVLAGVFPAWRAYRNAMPELLSRD